MSTSFDFPELRSCRLDRVEGGKLVWLIPPRSTTLAPVITLNDNSRNGERAFLRFHGGLHAWRLSMNDVSQNRAINLDVGWRLGLKLAIEARNTRDTERQGAVVVTDDGSYFVANYTSASESQRTVYVSMSDWSFTDYLPNSAVAVFDEWVLIARKDDQEREIYIQTAAECLRVEML